MRYRMSVELLSQRRNELHFHHFGERPKVLESENVPPLLEDRSLTGFLGSSATAHGIHLQEAQIQ